MKPYWYLLAILCAYVQIAFAQSPPLPPTITAIDGEVIANISRESKSSSSDTTQFDPDEVTADSLPGISPDADFEQLGSLFRKYPEVGNIELFVPRLEPLRAQSLDDRKLSFFGNDFGVRSAFESNNESVRFLTLADFDRSSERNTIAIAVDSSTQSMTGWINLNNKEYIVRPVPNKYGTMPPEGQHVLVQLKPLQIPRTYQSDFGDAVRKPESQRSAYPGESECFGSGDDALRSTNSYDLDSLDIYFEYTKQSFDKGFEDNFDPRRLVQNDRGALQQVLQKAGIRSLVINMHVNEKASTYVERDDKQLEQIVCELARSSKLSSGPFGKFQNERAQRNADIGILIVHRGSKHDCGHTVDVRDRPTMAVAVVNWKCIRNFYSYIHEIGHILGANHRYTEKKDRKPKHARAHFGDMGDYSFVTLMGRFYVECDESKRCHRYPELSDPALHGDTKGKDTEADNARAVRENIARISNFGEQL